MVQLALTAYDGRSLVDPPARRSRRVKRSRKGERMIDRIAVRGLDLVVASTILLLTAPVLIVVALAIWCHDGGPPIFVHWRIGRGGRKFPCLKFRTMVVNSSEHLARLLAACPASAEEWRTIHKLRVDPRVTRLGRFLRKSSLDEMPQLVNVIAGHMSLVGPRPIIDSEVSRYGRYFSDYCSVKPGITGLWQVSGRNDVSYRRRIVLDTVYARSKSLTTDLFVLSRTLPAVLSARGCS